MGRFRTYWFILVAAAMLAAASFGSSNSHAAPGSPIATVKIKMLTLTKIKVTVVANRTTPSRLKFFFRADSSANALVPSRVTPKGFEGRMDGFGNYIMRMPSLRPGQKFVVVASYPAAAFDPSNRHFTAGVVHKTTQKYVSVFIVK